MEPSQVLDLVCSLKKSLKVDCNSECIHHTERNMQLEHTILRRKIHRPIP